MRTFALLAATILGLAAAVLAVRAAPTEPAPPPAPPTEVAREIAKIQQQLGGSIVKGSNLESLAAPEPAGASLTYSPSTVSAIREAAWQLDKSAHNLESLDLYHQADALRELATQFRQEARICKGAAEKSE